MEKFIVSARKYRPSTFSSVVGQQHITSTFINAIKRNQLAHAYIFCGPRGVGKTTCARIVAKTINCLNPTPELEACDSCESCTAFKANSSFNIHELDAASNNSVDDIRELSRQVLIPPQIGKYSIYIIDEVHMLSSAAFNAFLKTLEEPPSYAIFILATTEKHKILPTILSRCQIYDFKRIKVENVVGYLQMISEKEKVQYDDASLTLIAQKADGCMRDALSMFDKVVSFCSSKLNLKDVAEALNILDYDTYFRLTDSLYEGDYVNSLVMFDEALQKGFDVSKILEGLNKHLRDMMVAKDKRTLPLLELTESIAAEFSKNASKIDNSFIFNAMSLITECEEKLRNSLNQRILAEITILKICNIKGICFTTPEKNKINLPEIKSSPVIITKTETITEEVKKVIKVEEITTKPIEDIVKPEVENIIEVVKAKKKREPVNKKALLGIPSLNNIVTKTATSVKQLVVVKEVEIVEVKHVSEEDLKTACQKFSEHIKDSQKRFSIAFSDVTIEGNKICMDVENQILADDINKTKGEILHQLCSIGDINGAIELEITVAQQEKREVIVYTNDQSRFKYLNEINPKLELLQKTLELDYKY